VIIHKKDAHKMTQSEGDIQSNRRSFLKKGALTAGAAIVGAGLFGAGKVAFSQESAGSLTRGDIAILRFLAAAELIESDLWTQYAELGGLTPGQVPSRGEPEPTDERLSGCALEP
jgi:hypothetical protein